MSSKSAPSKGGPSKSLVVLASLAISMSLAVTSCTQRSPNSNSEIEKAVESLPLPKEAVEAAWEKDIEEGEESNKQSMYQDAEVSLLRALKHAEKLSENDQRLERTLRGLCISYVGRGKFKDAEDVQRRLLNIYEKAGKGEQQRAANACLEIARALAEQKQYPESRSFYDRALSIFQKLQGDQNAQTAWVMHELAVLDEMDGKYALAEPLFRKAAQLHEAAAAKSGSSDGQNERFCLAIAANQRLANCLLEQQKFAEAVPLVDKLRAMHEKHVKSLSKEQMEDGTFGATELELSDLLQQVAYYSLSKNDSKTAEQLLKDTLAMKRKYYTVDDLDLTSTINALGELYLNRKDYKAAEPLLAEAYDIRERICDKDSWELAEVAEENARLMQGKKDTKRQKEFETVAFRLWPKETFVNKTPWRDHLVKGTKAQKMEDWDEATSQMAKSVEDARKFGANDARLAESLLRVSVMYARTSTTDKAEQCEREAYAIRKKIPAFAKLDAANSRANLKEGEGSGSDSDDIHGDETSQPADSQPEPTTDS